MRFQKYINEATYPLPKIEKNEIGLMTKEEYLKYRNPDEKYHESGSYDFDLKSLNKDYRISMMGRKRTYQGSMFTLNSTAKKNNYIIKKDEKIVAIVINGTMYYISTAVSKGDIPENYETSAQQPINLNIKKYERIKYITDKLRLVSNVISKNYKEYPVLIKRFKNFEGEYYEIRAEKKLVKDEGINLAMLNEKGEIVAVAQNEWGATLIVVAQEYRGKGLAKKIFDPWIEWNPTRTSGGMTAKGEKMSISFWEDRVRKFLGYGWYSELVKKKKITVERINKILSGLSKKAVYKPVQKKKSTKEEPLFLIGESNFVIYDKSFYDIGDYYSYDGTIEKTIYASGLFRDSSGVGTFLFSIDYEPKYRKMATEVALQMARDNGEKLYYDGGKSYADILELKGIANVKKEGNYIFLTKDVLPVKKLGAIEKRYRKERDQYDELFTIILETADSKWK